MMCDDDDILCSGATAATSLSSFISTASYSQQAFLAPLVSLQFIKFLDLRSAHSKLSRFVQCQPLRALYDGYL